jgi:hypothetical protein
MGLQKVPPGGTQAMSANAFVKLLESDRLADFLFGVLVGVWIATIAYWIKP